MGLLGLGLFRTKPPHSDQRAAPCRTQCVHVTPAAAALGSRDSALETLGPSREHEFHSAGLCTWERRKHRASHGAPRPPQESWGAVGCPCGGCHPGRWESGGRDMHAGVQLASSAAPDTGPHSSPSSQRHPVPLGQTPPFFASTCNQRNPSY